ncbi:M48 family metalloprotease [bacterium]|nr:M48 family metalloprotease [bacterium]
MQIQSGSKLRAMSPMSPRQNLARPPAGPDQVSLSGEVFSTDPRPGNRIGKGLLTALGLAGVASGLAGCSQQPPDQAQVQTQSTKLSYNFMSVEQEKQLGDQVAAQVEKETPVWHDAEAQARIERIGHLLTRDSSRTDITYDFKLLDTPSINAMALPGGHVYVTRGLYENYKDDGELMFVMGHEFGHVEQRHSIKQLEKASLVDLLGRALSHGHGDTGRVLVGLGEKLLANQFSQADESEADKIGQAHLLHLGVDPEKAVSAMQRLSDLTHSGGQSRISAKIFSDHPPTADRIEALRQNAIALKAK